MKKIFYYLGLGIVVIVFYLLSGFHFSPNLDLYFLNVGQGDSVLLRMPYTRQNVLIDGGPDDSVLRELGNILPLSEKKIDLIILTHPHADHLNGLNKILDHYEVGAVLGSAILSENEEYNYFFEKLNQKKIPFWVARDREDIQVGDVIVDIIHPENYLAFQNINNLNNSSIAVKVEYAGNKILLTGDSEEEEMLAMYKAGDDLKAKIYKAAHHGSKTSLFEPFLRVVNPEIVAVQCGLGNSYGHPHEEFLTRFADIDLLRNDFQGRIHLKLTKSGSVETVFDDG